jgi:hypothetical protein
VRDEKGKRSGGTAAQTNCTSRSPERLASCPLADDNRIFQPDPGQNFPNPLLGQLLDVESCRLAVEDDPLRRQLNLQIEHSPASPGQDPRFQLAPQVGKLVRHPRLTPLASAFLPGPWAFLRAFLTFSWYNEQEIAGG